MAGGYGQKFHTFEQRIAEIPSFFEYAPIKFQPRFFAVEEGGAIAQILPDHVLPNYVCRTNFTFLLSQCLRFTKPSFDDLFCPTTVVKVKTSSRLRKNSSFVSGHRFSDAACSSKSDAPLGAGPGATRKVSWCGGCGGTPRLFRVVA